MYEQCLMLRPHMQTSSLRAGRDGGTPCTTSFRVPRILRDVRCPSRCPCPNYTSMLEGEKAMKQRTARASPQPRGRLGRGTANLTHTVTARTWSFYTVKPFTTCGPSTGG